MDARLCRDVSALWPELPERGDEFAEHAAVLGHVHQADRRLPTRDGCARSARGEGGGKSVVTRCCPTCGHDLAPTSEIRVDLDRNTLLAGNHAVRLTPTQTELMFVLVEASPAVVPRDRLMSRMYGQSPDQPESDRIIDVFISKARERLRGTGIEIKAHWGRGYSVINNGRV